MFRTENLARRFGGLAAVNGVSLRVAKGEIRSIIGPNGAGKTTLFNLITGAVTPSSGHIYFNGCEITGMSPAAIFRLGIVRSFQISQVFPRLSVVDNVELLVTGRARASGRPFARLAGNAAEVRECALEALKHVGLAHRAGDLVETLSHGDRRLVEIAMVLGAGPKLLLLDEPTAGMSSEETKQVASVLQKLAPAVTLVIVEHDMSVVMAMSDRISVLHRGEILAEGSPDEIRRSLEVQAVYLGTPGND